MRQINVKTLSNVSSDTPAVHEVIVAGIAPPEAVHQPGKRDNLCFDHPPPAPQPGTEEGSPGILAGVRFPITTKSLWPLANPGPLENLIRRQF